MRRKDLRDGLYNEILIQRPMFNVRKCIYPDYDRTYLLNNGPIVFVRTGGRQIDLSQGRDDIILSMEVGVAGGMPEAIGVDPTSESYLDQELAQASLYDDQMDSILALWTPRDTAPLRNKVIAGHYLLSVEEINAENGLDVEEAYRQGVYLTVNTFMFRSHVD